ncbi:putative fatty acid elongation protein 3 [Halotydeus destructor]|nr:putative fatty acid elongation protein 3 [Halotydeus destructor]
MFQFNTSGPHIHQHMSPCTGFSYNWTYNPPEKLYVQHVLVLPFEKNFDFVPYHMSLSQSFHSWIYYVLISYLVIIFSLKTLMANRKPFDLRRPLIAWNFALAVFSAYGSFRTMTELWSVFKAEGIDGTICHEGHAFGVTGLWTLLFVMSKIPEMIDTVFITLRKRPLIFLHWYHHLETCFYSIWAYTSPRFPVSRWFISVNYTVHAFMYTYYALSASGFRLPRKVAMTITTAQVAQMFVGLYVVIRAFSLECYNHRPPLWGGLLTYTVYAIMFTNYFVRSYLLKPKSKAA